MTPKQKAKELVEKFEVSEMTCENIHLAILCVEEVINTFLEIDPKKKYWKEVKQELKLL